MLVCDSCSFTYLYTGLHYIIISVCVCVCVSERERNLFQTPAASCAVLTISCTGTIIKDRWTLVLVFKTLQVMIHTRVLDRIKHKHSFIIHHILVSVLYAVKTAAPTVLTFPLIADISKAAVIIWVLYTRVISNSFGHGREDIYPRPWTLGHKNKPEVFTAGDQHEMSPWRFFFNVPSHIKKTQTHRRTHTQKQLYCDWRFDGSRRAARVTMVDTLPQAVPHTACTAAVCVSLRVCAWLLCMILQLYIICTYQHKTYLLKLEFWLCCFIK